MSKELKDLIRKNLDVVVLLDLLEKDKTGYEILNSISQKSKGFYFLRQNNLYLIIKQLESKELINSYKKEEFNSQTFYSITDLGKEYAQHEKNEWIYIRTILSNLISSEDFNINLELPFDASSLQPTSKKFNFKNDISENNEIEFENQFDDSLEETNLENLDILNNNFLSSEENIEDDDNEKILYDEMVKKLSEECINAECNNNIQNNDVFNSTVVLTEEDNKKSISASFFEFQQNKNIDNSLDYNKIDEFNESELYYNLETINLKTNSENAMKDVFDKMNENLKEDINENSDEKSQILELKEKLLNIHNEEDTENSLNINENIINFKDINDEKVKLIETVIETTIKSLNNFDQIINEKTNINIYVKNLISPTENLIFDLNTEFKNNIEDKKVTKIETYVETKVKTYNENNILLYEDKNLEKQIKFLEEKKEISQEDFKLLFDEETFLRNRKKYEDSLFSQRSLDIKEKESKQKLGLDMSIEEKKEAYINQFIKTSHKSLNEDIEENNLQKIEEIFDPQKIDFSKYSAEDILFNFKDIVKKEEEAFNLRKKEKLEKSKNQSKIKLYKNEQ